MATSIIYTNSRFLEIFTPFIPRSSIISNITNSSPAVVTVTQDHGYLDGLQVRMVFPGNFGMTQLNGNLFFITVLSPTSFSIPVDTSNFDSYNPGSNLTPSQVIPVGEVADSLLQATRNSGVLEVFTPNPL